MECRVLCCDYDGTVADEGVLSSQVITALERLVKAGRYVILVTGRQLDDLLHVCSRLDLFRKVVAENGAVLYDPVSRESRLLTEPPPAEFVQRLRARIQPISFGQAIIATSEPHDIVVHEIIRELGLEWQVIFNKGAVMVLPAGVNKASGLAAALDEAGFSPHNAAAVGDAENDHALLSSCEWGIAVANAVPTLKDRADFVTREPSGAGVSELITEIIETDLASRDALLTRHHIVLGHTPANTPFAVSPRRFNTLLLGGSGAGKTTASLSLIERFAERRYTFCVIDPEGDYEVLENAALIGTPTHAPDLVELDRLLATIVDTVVSLVGVSVDDRPAFFTQLMSRIEHNRNTSGMPHLLVIDEAHHVSPLESATQSAPLSGMNVLRVTVHPQTLAPQVLRDVRVVMAVGPEAHERLREFSEARGIVLPPLPTTELGSSEAWVWRLELPDKPERVSLIPSHIQHRRHTRKYAEGELPEDRSFYFRGPQNKLNLRAQNLLVFLQLAQGVDDATWDYHLHRRDYSNWISTALRDADLARAIKKIEENFFLSSAQTRDQIRQLIEQRYTAPASAS